MIANLHYMTLFNQSQLDNECPQTTLQAKDNFLTKESS